ncbi:hypothetical protein RRG08_057652 [Elysia crispata]|uniref:Uncharacterized protein n=1 Tax=Elysia crispata TaxID=231223 RepID=A0AAE1DQR5_9GAST|nr:hypothetical protein RRG08_057652 [Elysia crispata]
MDEKHGSNLAWKRMIQQADPEDQFYGGILARAIRGLAAKPYQLPLHSHILFYSVQRPLGVTRPVLSAWPHSVRATLVSDASSCPLACPSRPADSTHFRTTPSQGERTHTMTGPS